MIHRVANTPFRVVLESPEDSWPVLVLDEWRDALPWVVQGTTTSGGGLSEGTTGAPFDLGLFSEGSSEAAVRRNWRTLADGLQATAVVHAHQPHGCVVRAWVGETDVAEVPCLVDPCDGHITRTPGVVLAVTAADCVPVFVVDPSRRAVAMVHAGWRGVAAGILETALESMADRFDTRPDDVRLHLGPAICGDCYEVGPEVHQALGQRVPASATPIDLRAILGNRAVVAGVSADRVSISGHCTLCGDVGLFSHRRGDAQRQVGFLGIRG